MNRAQLVKAVAKESGLDEKDAAKAVDALFAIVKDALKQGDEVRLPGFGTFTVARARAASGRNPRTGGRVSAAGSLRPRFKASRALMAGVGEDEDVEASAEDDDDGFGGPRIGS